MKYYLRILLWLVFISVGTSVSTCSAQPNTAPFYIIIGESNTGWAPVKDLPDSSLVVYKAPLRQTDIFNPGRGGYKASFEKLQAGVNTMCENFADPATFGPEVSLLKSLQSQKHQQRFVYKQGQANTSLVIDWKPVHPYTGAEGSRFRQLEEWLALAADQADKLGYKLDLKGVIMIGGENDSRVGRETRAALYGNALKEFFAGFDQLWNGLTRQHGLPKTSYKKVICRVNAPGASFPYRELVRKAQTAFCAEKSNNAIMINMDNYSLLDYVHYTASSQVQLGMDIFKAAKFE